MEKEPEFHMFHMIKHEDGKEPFKAHINRFGEVHTSNNDTAMEYKLNVVRRMCGDGYKHDWQDPFLVLLGTIAELEEHIHELEYDNKDMDDKLTDLESENRELDCKNCDLENQVQRLEDEIDDIMLENKEEYPNDC